MRNKKEKYHIVCDLGILFLVLAVTGVFLIKNTTEKRHTGRIWMRDRSIWKK